MNVAELLCDYDVDDIGRISMSKQELRKMIGLCTEKKKKKKLKIRQNQNVQ